MRTRMKRARRRWCGHRSQADVNSQTEVVNCSGAAVFEVEEHQLFTATDLLRLNDFAKSENINVVSNLISSWSDNKSFFGE